MLKAIREAVDFIQKQTSFQPKTGIVLGTGLGGLVDKIDIQHKIDYKEIPHFPLSTVESHTGTLIFGNLKGEPVIAMQGRFHFYEGYDMNQIVFPIRVMKLLGIEQLFVSNAAGGINPDFNKGDLMIFQDHINLFSGNPLIGKNHDELGPRFVDMYQPYEPDWIKKGIQFATEKGFGVQKGVYAGLPGPMLETPAEYKFLSVIGADAVGMSTIPEIIAAKHMELKCFACSIITDICYGEIQPVNIEEIIAVAMKAEPHLTELIAHLIGNLN
jgi:purine-nucleoside phosphorylase